MSSSVITIVLANVTPATQTCDVNFSVTLSKISCHQRNRKRTEHVTRAADELYGLQGTLFWIENQCRWWPVRKCMLEIWPQNSLGCSLMPGIAPCSWPQDQVPDHRIVLLLTPRPYGLVCTNDLAFTKMFLYPIVVKHRCLLKNSI